MDSNFSRTKDQTGPILLRRRRELRKERDELRKMIQGNDPELAELAQDELQAITELLEQNVQELRESIQQQNKSGEKALLEIRAGTGGQEAAIFAANLLRMYVRYAQLQSWSAEITENRTQEPGGTSRAGLIIEGPDAYRKLRRESGTHRVQRVPSTDAQGRIHTSTATIAVLPEAEIPEVRIRPQDIHIDTMRGSGHGGQAINKLSTAVRIVHIPTGTTVTCQDERSLKQNREKAMDTLYARLLEAERQRINKETAGDRREQVGTAGRTEKVRTYNHQQDRVTDHRIRKSFRPLQRIMDGDLEEISSALAEAEAGKQEGNERRRR